MTTTTKQEALSALSPAARAVWDAKPPAYRSQRADGELCVLYLNPETGGTELWPVENVAKVTP